MSSKFDDIAPLYDHEVKQAIQDNYNQIKEDVKQIVKDELERIAADENLKHLIQK